MALYKVDSDTADLTKVAGGTLYADNPIGSILPYGGAIAPSGWFICQGQAISRSNYAELFNVIGTTFGAGDGSTTFNLPDLREATTKGVGLSGKSSNHYDSDGIALGDFVDDRIKLHAHHVYVKDTGHTHSVDATSASNIGVSVSLACCAINITPSTMQPTTTTGLSSSLIRVNSEPNYAGSENTTSSTGAGSTTEVKAVGVNYIVKAKHVSVPADFTDSLIGYLGQETNYNLYPWSHVKSDEGVDINQDITIERNGWYSIDYTMTSNTNVQHTFTFRDFDALGEVHTIMRFMYDKSGTFRQTFLVPLKAGTYRYSHGGVGTLSVYMNRRDFAY